MSETKWWGGNQNSGETWLFLAEFSIPAREITSRELYGGGSEINRETGIDMYFTNYTFEVF